MTLTRATTVPICKELGFTIDNASFTGKKIIAFSNHSNQPTWVSTGMCQFLEGVTTKTGGGSWQNPAIFDKNYFQNDTYDTFTTSLKSS